MGQPLEPDGGAGRLVAVTAAPAVERRRAFDVVRAVRRGERAEDALARAARGLDARRRPFLMELSYGTIRWRLRLDHHLDELLDEGVGSLPPDVLSILELGAYQILLMDGVPPWSAVDESVRLARRLLPARDARWATGLVNAVLRNLARRKDELALPGEDDPVRRLAVEHSHPEWLVERWLARFGRAATVALLARDNTPPPVHLALHPGRATLESALAELRAAGVEAAPHPAKPDAIVLGPGAAPDRLHGWAEGRFWVQDAGAQWVAAVLEPPARGWILDAFAAPGGKLAALLARAPELRALALDVDPARLARVEENRRRLGLEGARPVAADAAAPPTAARFPLVLADVPCSGTGVLRRRVDARWRRRAGDVDRFAAVQRSLLAALAERVQPGGTLLYATCSLEREENQDVVTAFLSSRPDFRIVPVDAPDAVREGPFLQTRPWEVDLDGMFAARLVREDG